MFLCRGRRKSESDFKIFPVLLFIFCVTVLIIFTLSFAQRGGAQQTQTCSTFTIIYYKSTMHAIFIQWEEMVPVASSLVGARFSCAS